MNVTTLPIELRLQYLRSQANLTQRELAERSGLHLSSITAIEQGLKSPRRTTAQKLADAFNARFAETTYNASVSAAEILAEAPDGSGGELKTPDGEMWVSSGLLDPQAGKPLRASWERDNPGKPWPHATLTCHVIRAKRHKVTSYGSPPIKGAVRALHVTLAVPVQGGGKAEKKCWRYSLPDARKVETPHYRETDGGDELRGRWLGDDAYFLEQGTDQLPPGEYVTENHLSATYQKLDPAHPGREIPVVNPPFWSQAIRRRTTYLSPHVNGGKIRSFRKRRPTRLAPSKAQQTNGTIQRVTATLLYKPDCTEVINQMLDPEAKSPAMPGKWMDDDQTEFDHAQLGTCYVDWVFARRCHASRQLPGYWRRHGHVALPKEMNGGKLPFDEVLRILPDETREMVIVSSWKAGILIRGLREEGRTATSNLAKLREKGLLSRREIAGTLAIEGKRGLLDLGLVLIWFGQQKPEAVTTARKWVLNKLARKESKGGRSYTHQRYEFATLQRWLKNTGKTIPQLADEVRQSRGEWPLHAKLLQKAKSFLILVLTSKEFGAASDRLKDRSQLGARKSRRYQFRKFLARPPYGEPLQPLADGIAAANLRQWAEDVGISHGLLADVTPIARKEMGVVYDAAAGGRWRLTKPIILERPAMSAAEDNGAPVNGQDAPASQNEATRVAVPEIKRRVKRPGPDANPKNQRIYHVCAEVYHAPREGKRSGQLAEVHRRLSEMKIRPDRVKNVATMREYATKSRYHKPTICPLCLEKLAR